MSTAASGGAVGMQVRGAVSAAGGWVQGMQEACIWGVPFTTITSV